MAKYTLELRELVEFEGREEIKNWFKDYDLKDYLTANQINDINNRGVWTKDKLADLIIDHYYMREIGLETPALFKLKAKVAMREIMEEKAPMIWTASLGINPFEEFEVNTSSDTSGGSSVNNSGDSLNIHSNTPQGRVSKTEILNGDYASDTDANENNSQSKTNEESHNTTKSTGRNRSQVLLAREYRENIVMINREIVNDLADLFMGIY